MPLHTKKKFYKAEYQFWDNNQEKYLELEDTYYTTDYPGWDNYQGELPSQVWKYAFDTSWTSTLGNCWCHCDLCYDDTIGKGKQTCLFRKCDCHYCNELRTMTLGDILLKYYNFEDILLMNKSETLEGIKNNKCYLCCVSQQFRRPKLHTNILQENKKYMYAHILSGKSNLEPFQCQKLNMRLIGDCTILKLKKYHIDMIKEYHIQRDYREKYALLYKYGKTYEDYLEFRKQRQEFLQTLQIQENPTQLPKQKFLKIKESQIKCGDF